MPYKDIDKRREKNREYYHKHKDTTPGARYKKIKHNLKKWRKNNKTLVNKKSRDWSKSEAGKRNREKNKDKFNAYRRKEYEEMREVYIVKLLREQGFSRKEINDNPELIRKKREVLRIKRELRKSTSLIKDKKKNVR